MAEEEATHPENVVAQSAEVQSEPTENTGQGDASPRSYLFMVGFFVPIFSGLIIIYILTAMPHNGPFVYGPEYSPKHNSDVELDNVTYDVYDVTMTDGFSEHFAHDCHYNCWEFLAKVSTAGGDIEWKIEGHSDEPSSSHFEQYLENGNTWYMMKLTSCEEYSPGFDCDENSDEKMFIKFNTDDTVNIATNYAMPTYIEYTYTDSDFEKNQQIRHATLLFWPISMLVGIVWGLMSNRKQFAYGLMAGGALCISIPIIAFIDAIMSGALT